VTDKLLISTRLPTCAPGAPDRSIKGNRVVIPERHTFDNYSGVYKIPGTVAVAGTPDVPVSRRVNLMLAKSGRLARTMLSDASGVYEFRMVGRGPWFVTAHDHTGEYNAEIADNILGEPI
jgi:hypothetical protein